MNNIYERLMSLVLDMGIGDESTNEESLLKDDLGMDSLDITELQMKVDREFGTEFQNDDWSECTIGDVVREINEAM